MTKKKSSTTRLDALYKALKIPQEGKIPCLGPLFFNKACTADQKDQRKSIQSTLHDIIDTIESGYTTGSNEVQDLLEDLAERLVCTDMAHDQLSSHGHGVCGKHEHVAILLDKRLKGWHKYMDGETPESTRSNTPTKPRHCKQAESSDDDDEYVEDGDESYDDEDWEYEYEDEGDDENLSKKDSEEDDEGVTVPAKKSTVLRPKPIRKAAYITPIKQRGRPSRNSRPRTPRMRQEVDPFDSLSILNDALPLSPESVISPGVSEVFSPVSTASTPMSIPDSEIRPSRYRYLRGEEESPTRGRWSSKGNDLLDGDKSNRRAPNKDSVWSLSRTSKYDNDSTTTRKKRYRKGNEQLDQGSQLSSQDSDNQRQIDDDDEEFEGQPKSNDKKALFPLKVGNMLFDLPREDRSPLNRLLERLQKSLHEKSLSSGWVYCFAERTAPGYLKIGYKQYEDKNSNAILSLEEQKDAAQVMKRLRMWERECKHNIDYKFIFYMPYAVQTMEGLIHRTLHERNRKAHCPNPACKKGHREWFEISEMEARRAVEVWQQFSELMPYTEKGQLKSFWHNRTRDDLASYSHLPVEEWVYERWVKVIVPAVVEREKRISELERKKTQVAERRKEAQERKKELELEIHNLLLEENEVRGKLDDLQSQH